MLVIESLPESNSKFVSFSGPLTYAQVFLVHGLVGDPIDVLELRPLRSERPYIRRAFIWVSVDERTRLVSYRSIPTTA